MRRASWVAGVVLCLGPLCVSLRAEETTGGTPSFSRQTGLACSACHTTMPELTALGRRFKLNGYTLSAIEKIEEEGHGTRAGLSLLRSLPLSINLRTAFTQTGSAQPGTRNGNIQVPQQVNVWLAGALSEYIGAYVQMTYRVASDHFSFDNSDIRYARSTKLSGKDLVWGIDFNNNPTFEDLWHSTPAYGFPWASADAVPTPAATTIIDGSLAGDVVGLGTYAMWNDHFYGYLGAYRSQHIGGPQPATDSGFAHNIRGVAPYWRLAYQTAKGPNYFELGTYGIHMESFPGAISGPVDAFTDAAGDFTYERTLGSNLLTVHGTYIHETQTLDATFGASGATQSHHDLETARVDVGYHFGNRYTTTAGAFYTSGTADTVLYAPGKVTGAAGGNPQTDGYIAQLGYWPSQNIEIGLQYKGYLKYNGATSNYDGFGRNASANNVVYLFLWFTF